MAGISFPMLLFQPASMVSSKRIPQGLASERGPGRLEIFDNFVDGSHQFIIQRHLDDSHN
jgi:folylpolyglutamate synthase/dihydropteroate synthase